MTAFLFGKLPAHGDFIARGLALGERDALDMWLSAEMTTVRDNAAFEDAFDAAPVWRFAFTDGSAWRAGVLAPSVDAVGRRFPLLFGWTDLTTNAVDVGVALAEASLFSAISEGWDADRLAALDPPPPGADDLAQPREGWWTDTRGIAFTDLHPTNLLRAMLGTKVPA